jgi:two-component system osmolarity sensor histidine kinase EnvZ
MSLSQIASPEAARGLARYDPFRILKRFLPRGLFWRSLLIIVTPVVLLQGVVSYVFFERDLESTTHWMARDIAADTAFLVSLEDSHSPVERAALRAQASRTLGYPVTFLPGRKIDLPARRHRRHPRSGARRVIAQRGGRQPQFRSDRHAIHHQHRYRSA